MRRRYIANFAGCFLLISLSGLGGCGQIGPLYLPEAEPASETEPPAANLPVPAPEESKPV
ncbi:MAG: lipoprotein [Halioglobus sp.]